MREEDGFLSRLAESFRKIGETLLKLFGGDFPVFLLFLAISFLFWWSGSMSGNYEFSFQIPVEIKGVPDNLRVTRNPVQQVNVIVEGKGTALWKAQRAIRRSCLTLDNRQFVKGQGRGSYSTLWLADSLQGILPSNVTVRSIQPDSIAYQGEWQHKVTVPVVFDGQFESQSQFFMESVSFAPDSVRVTVPASDTVARKAMARTGVVELVADTMTVSVPLSFDSDVKSDVNEVSMTVIAQQYTEKTLEVPVSGINFPENVILKSFPSKAVVVFWVKMNDFDRIGAADFKLVVDYNEIEGGNSDRATLHVFAQPAGVRNVRLQTQVVEFLMEKTYL